MASQKTELDGAAISVLFILCASWGFAQVTIKIANQGISPVLQGGIRSIGATALLWAWMYWRRIPIFEKDGSLVSGIAAGAFFSIEFLLIYWGLEFTTASRSVIFLYTMPFMVAIGARWFIPNEKLRFTQVLGLCFAFAGILAAFSKASGRFDTRMLTGDLMIVGAAALWSAVTILVKTSPLLRIHPAKTLFYQLVSSAVLLPLGSLVMGEAGVMNLTPLVAACVVYQTVWVAFITYLAWFWVVQRYPAPRLASFMFLTPVFGVFSGALVLGEPLTPSLLLTLSLVAAGIFLVNQPGNGVNRSVTENAER